jgi:hypothetical protein
MPPRGAAPEAPPGFSSQMRHAALIGFIVLPGVATMVVSGAYLLQDWFALRAAVARFEQVAASDAELPVLFVAEAKQNLHRINCFAEGVGVLLGAILVAIGIHGLCTLRGKSS